jgi:hypothetical protein
MFGYFLRRVDKRFQLESALGLLQPPADAEEAVARLERLFAQVRARVGGCARVRLRLRARLSRGAVAVRQRSAGKASRVHSGAASQRTACCPGCVSCCGCCAAG